MDFPAVLARWRDQFVNGGIGATAYYSELFIHDRNGLVNHEVATTPAVDAEMRSPGHDKTVGIKFFLDHKPEVIRAGLVKGLLQMELGKSEQYARAYFYRVLKDWELKLSRPEFHLELRHQYVVDFRPIPDWEVGGPNQYLIMWRRIPDDVAPAAAWADFERRARQYRVGIDENRKIMDEGYPGSPASAD